jgi:hypothetical protein
MCVRQREEIRREGIEEEVEDAMEGVIEESVNDQMGTSDVIVENEQAEDWLSEEDKELERFFQIQLDNLNHFTELQLEPREKLPKVTLSSEMQRSANKILEMYLKNVVAIPEITDKVYAMAKAIAYKLGVKQNERYENRTRKASGGNRRERKLKSEIKELRQDIARTSNELHRRRQRRKASEREKQILKKLETKMNQSKVTSDNLRIMKEQCIDKQRYKKIKLEKCIEKRRKKQDNFLFQRDQKSFFKKFEGNVTREGKMPGINKFVEFWRGIWER